MFSDRDAVVRLDLDDVIVGADRLVGPADGSAYRRLRHLLVLAGSAEQLGICEGALALTAAYAKTREQFGRPIGSFQAIKHKCADMMLRVESARSAAYHAGCVAAEGGEELGVAASLAKATCSDAFFHCAAEAIQIHGGVGFTWEYAPHLYFKRAQSGAALLGSSALHRERVARHVLGDPA